jgi:NADH:ubiquinone oxidoreductase subunit 4 (subunit M)
MYQRVFFGKVNRDANAALTDISTRERIALWPTALAALAMGVAPLLWLNAIAPAVRTVLSPLAQMAEGLMR